MLLKAGRQGGSDTTGDTDKAQEGHCHDLTFKCRRIQVGPVLIDAAEAIECDGGEGGGQVDPYALSIRDFTWFLLLLGLHLSKYLWHPLCLNITICELDQGVSPSWTSILILYQPVFIKQLLLQKMLSYHEGVRGDNRDSWLKRIS